MKRAFRITTSFLLIFVLAWAYGKATTLVSPTQPDWHPAYWLGYVYLFGIGWLLHLWAMGDQQPSEENT